MVEAASRPGGWDGLVYRRLHGSPEADPSPYTPEALVAVSRSLAQEAERADTWCVLDNTALGHAIPDALRLLEAATHPAGGTFPFI